MENMFNGMLKQIRKEKGFTQEQLAEAVGVSPQAVSKWEQNGFPDAALLPEIADFLGVTIDELFGRKSENISFYDRFLKYLADVPQTERIQRIFELCRLTGASMLGVEEYNEFLFSNIGGYSYTQGTYDSGYLQCRLHSDRPYYLLVPEPEKGYESVVPYDEAFVRLFELLATPYALRTMYFLETRQSTFFNSKTLVREFGISKKCADDIIEKMLKLDFIWEADFDSGANSEKIYQYKVGIDFVSFMYFAQVLLYPPHGFTFSESSRNKPCFNGKTYNLGRNVPRL